MKGQFRRISDVQLSDIIDVWDALAESRYQEISSGEDRSYNQVLLPLMNDFISKRPGESLIDIGCGVGFVARSNARYFKKIIGIDPSLASIEYAKSHNHCENIQYITSTAEQYAKNGEQHDVLACSMVLMDTPNLKDFVTACYNLTKKNGEMVFSLCHPSFWPRYWGFEKYSWFNYGSEIAVGSFFRTSSTGISQQQTVYFHRPIQTYINALSNLGVSEIRIKEITGRATSSNQLNKYPRYLSIEVRK